MSDALIAALGTPAAMAVMLAGVLWWLGKTAWPQFIQRLDDTNCAIKDGFHGFDRRIRSLERNDRIRMKAGYIRELREQGVPPEKHAEMVKELFGNGDSDGDH